MPIEEPIQNLPAPINSDPPDGPTQMAAINAATVDRLNMRFASVAARDAALPNPVDGMEAMTGSGPSAVKWIYVNGRWRMLATPTSSMVTRLTYSDGEVFQSMASGVTLMNAKAIVDQSTDGESTCTIRFAVSGLSVSDGNQNTDVGNLVSALSPSGAVPLSGYRTNGALRIAITGGGSVGVRWSSAAASNQMFFAGAYTI